MSNNVTVSVTADVADLQVKRAVLSAELRQAQADLNSFAKTANASGMTDGLRASMLGAAQSVTKIKGELAQLDQAVVGHTAHLGNAREGYEALRVAQALLTGDFARAGTEATRFGERLAAGAEVAANAEMLLGLGAVAVVAGLGYLVYKEIEAEQQARQLADAFALSGRASQVSAAGIEAQLDSMSELPGISRDAAQSIIAFDAAHVEVNANLARMVNDLLPQYARALGKQAPEAVDHLKTALAELSNVSLSEAVAKFDELNRTTLNLAPTEAAAVEQMLRLGDTTGATTRILEDLAQRGGAHIDDVDAAVKRTTDALQQAKERLDAVTAASATAFDPSYPDAYAGAVADAAKQVQGLTGDLVRLQAAAAAAHQDSFADALERSNATLGGLRDNATRAKDAVAELHREMELRRQQTPNDPTVTDYFAHQQKYDTALTRQQDPADNRRQRSGSRRDDVVAELRTQLQEQLEEEKNYFGDATAEELAFWNKSLATTRLSAEQKRQINTEIYNLERTSAHQAYDAQIATLKDQLEADKNNWLAEQAGLDVQVAIVRAKYAEGSAEVQDALRERAEKIAEHEAQVEQIAHDGAEAALRQLKQSLDDAAKLREGAARIAEAQAEARGRSAMPGAEVGAAKDVAAIHQQQSLQAMAALETDYAEGNLQRQTEIVGAALLADGQQSKAYTDAVNAKKEADEAFAAQHRQLEQQMVLQSIEDAQKVQQAWHSYIDSTVQSFGSGIEGMINRTETLRQFEFKVLGDMETRAVQGVERMVQNWIVGELTKTLATDTANSAMKASNATAASQSVAINALANVKRIESDAAAAAAAAYKAMAGIPPAPLWGVAAGAAAFAGVMAFESVASAAGGFDIPAGMNPVTQLHAREMVLPPSLADNVRNMTGAAGGGHPLQAGYSPAGGGRGHVLHANYSPTIHAHQPPSLKRMLERDGDDFFAFFRTAVRNGQVKF